MAFRDIKMVNETYKMGRKDTTRRHLPIDSRNCRPLPYVASKNGGSFDGSAVMQSRASLLWKETYHIN